LEESLTKGQNPQKEGQRSPILLHFLASLFLLVLRELGLTQFIENVKLVGFWNSSGKIFGQSREREKVGNKA
jgi:hypothetical protein